MAQALSTGETATSAEPLRDLLDRLEQAEGFAAVRQALRAGQSGTIDGAWGSAAAATTATLARHCPGTLLVVLAHPRDVDGWLADLMCLTGAAPALFPAWDSWPPPGDEVAGQRLRLLRRLESADPPRLILTTIQALVQPTPDRALLQAQRRVLEVGTSCDLDDLARWLVEHGFQPADVVEAPGEFSRRGGIVDIYSPDGDHPYRIEFFGDDIDSIRTFSPGTQRSLGTTERAIITGQIAFAGAANDSATFEARPPDPATMGHCCDYLPPGSWTILVEAEELVEQGRHFHDRVTSSIGLFSVEGALQELVKFPSVRLAALPSPTVETSCHLRVESVERFSGDVARVRDELDTAVGNDEVLIACQNDAEVKRLGEVLATGRLAQAGRLHLRIGHIHAGFRLVGEAGALVVLGGQELFRREDARPIAPRRRLESRAIDSFLDLQEGDLVVHVSHGIARFRGMQMLEKTAANGAATRQTEEHLTLEFRDGVKLYVPATKIDLVQKYVGGGTSEPELSKLGGSAWEGRKARVQEAVRDLACEMLQLQAVRAAQAGFPFPRDSEWQSEFEAAFPYRETPDQLTSLAEIKSDMERPRPMDRLLCGDVGYGKTELAVRAAFKAVDNGKQVAVLVPTTVLAEQHFRTFRQRLSEYPFTVECLSRFRTAGEQRRIVERVAKGQVDIAIGTHRLVSADVKFKELGLVIIDEEQRFGVEHKERLKQLRAQVDVLTLTATPIPRTLHLSLLGIRDISNLETPPPDRLAIETRISRFDRQLIRHAILRELNREGQVYFVHNRVQNIYAIAERVQSIVPEARIVVGHGQMTPHELEEAMLKFVRREADILVATTIIESGLDIPNANTIFINQADNYGLADLHQLRGRVGRYRHRAYAYLLLDADRAVTPQAAKRLKAIEEFTDLGAGFKIALRDLEIRGAGNILGTQQSGHIASVGYELYCQLLENAVRQMKNEPVRTPLEVTIDLPWHAYLPREYVAGQRARIEVYRRLARVRRLEKLEDFRQELRDRYGPLPEPAEWLLRLTELRLRAARWKVATVHLEKPPAGVSGPTDVVLGYRHRKRIDELAASSGGRLRVVDDHSAYFRLRADEHEPTRLYETLRRLLRD